MTKTLTQRMDALEAAVLTLVTALTPSPAAVPAKGAPAKAAAKSPAFGDKTFSEYVADRQAARIGCAAGHAPEICNRTFSPKSSGATDHVARIVAAKA